MKNIECEILAPVAEVKQVKKVINAGADAIYCGFCGYSARPQSSDMTVEEIIKAKEIASKNNTKLYVAINAVIQEESIDDIISQIKQLDEASIDAFIISDYGLLDRIMTENLKAAIHISTLAGVVNQQTVKRFKMLGCNRIILSSDLFIDEIESIIADVPDMEYEIVADGGICFNNNRQCLLPHMNEKCEFSVLCQSKFDIWDEEKYIKKARPIGNPPIIIHDALGLYMGIGVLSFKIEGRTNDIQYIIRRTKDMKKNKDYYIKNKERVHQSLHYISRGR